MQFLGDLVSFRKTFGKSSVDSRGDMSNSKPSHEPDQPRAAYDRQNGEPRRLKPRRRDREAGERLGFAPDTIVVTGHHPKLIRSRTKVGVEGLTACSRILPVVVSTVKLVLEKHSLRD